MPALGWKWEVCLESRKQRPVSCKVICIGKGRKGRFGSVCIDCWHRGEIQGPSADLNPKSPEPLGATIGSTAWKNTSSHPPFLSMGLVPGLATPSMQRPHHSSGLGGGRRLFLRGLCRGWAVFPEQGPSRTELAPASSDVDIASRMAGCCPS